MYYESTFVLYFVRKYFRKYDTFVLTTYLRTKVHRIRTYVHTYCIKVVLYVIRKKPAKNVLVTKYTYKSVRANTRARNTTPSSNEIATIFSLHHLVPGINAELAKPGILRSCSLPRVGYAIVAKRDFGQDLRFLRDAREIRKTPA